MQKTRGTPVQSYIYMKRRQRRRYHFSDDGYAQADDDRSVPDYGHFVESDAQIAARVSELVVIRGNRRLRYVDPWWTDCDVPPASVPTLYDLAMNRLQAMEPHRIYQTTKECHAAVYQYAPADVALDYFVSVYEFKPSFTQDLLIRRYRLDWAVVRVYLSPPPPASDQIMELCLPVLEAEELMTRDICCTHPYNREADGYRGAYSRSWQPVEWGRGKPHVCVRFTMKPRSATME